MKKILIAALIGLFLSSASAQKISKITLARDGAIESIYFLLEDGVTASISETGDLTGWGEEMYSDRLPNMSRLEKYMGRVEYYSNYDNESFRGKVKYIGKTQITYYGSYDKEELRGKVRSIGAAIFDYYSKFENDAMKGKIKKAGSVDFNWYSSFDNESFKGKIKSIGSTNITYYASYDDKAIRGRLKSIDRSAFTYYLSTERQEYQGALKSGSQMQTINGIRYYVKF